MRAFDEDMAASSSSVSSKPKRERDSPSKKALLGTEVRILSLRKGAFLLSSMGVPGAIFYRGKLLPFTTIQNPPYPSANKDELLLVLYICLSRVESTTNQCRMNSRSRSSRGLRRANDISQARSSGSPLSLQLPGIL